MTQETASPRSSLEVVRMDCPCGWCLTNHCSECKAELVWYTKLYICGCKKCCDGHPLESDVESKTEDLGEDEDGNQTDEQGQLSD
jgi:hypothetical protein